MNHRSVRLERQEKPVNELCAPEERCCWCLFLETLPRYFFVPSHGSVGTVATLLYPTKQGPRSNTTMVYGSTRWQEMAKATKRWESKTLDTSEICRLNDSIGFDLFLEYCHLIDVHSRSAGMFAKKKKKRKVARGNTNRQSTQETSVSITQSVPRTVQRHRVRGEAPEALMRSETALHQLLNSRIGSTWSTASLLAKNGMSGRIFNDVRGWLAWATIDGC